MNKILHFSSLYLLSSFLFILSLFITNQNLQAQTVLSQGDIAVIGVNANNGSCAPLLTGEDKISFVCFKPITTNTQICITDCAYISSTNTWAENEGLACMTYTGGATIAAGTIITFSSSGVTPSATNNPYVGTYPVVAPGTGAMPYAATPGTWSFSTPTPPYVGGSAFNVSMNMNVGGDQIYFMQGGTWTNPAGANNATYPAANVLYGFSTTTTPGFVAGAPAGTGQSNLVPSLECNVMAPSSATDWSFFVPPAPAPTTQAGWISAINNPANWPARVSCSLYNTAFATQYASGTLFSPPTPPGVLPSGLLTAIPAVAICGTVPLSGYDLTQNNAAIIGSSGILSANVYWYTADPSQGTNANTTKIPAPTSYTFASASVTLYAAEAPTLAASITKRCNTVAVTFNISTAPTLTISSGFRCNGVNSLLNTPTATPSAGATVNWYAASSGGPSLGTGNTYTPSLLPTTNTTYYAEATLAGGLCPVRVPVQLYVGTCESSCQSTNVTPTNETCANADDGTATLNFVPQGSPAFFTPLATGGVSALHNYLWNDPAPAQITNPATALAPGNYQVTVTGDGTIWSDAITAGTPWTYLPTNGIPGMPTTVNGASPNAWIIGTGEPGPPSPIAAGGVCAGFFPADATLKISTNPNPASTASYNVGANNVTSVAAISPTFSTVGFSGGSAGGLKLVFDYMEVSQNTVDNMTVYYSPDGGANWAFLIVGGDPPSTYNAGCAPVKAKWDTWTVNLPVTANNNPNNKIAFVWVNNGDGITGNPSAPPGTTISCAINNIRILHSCTWTQSTTINAAPNFTVALGSSAASACENGAAPTLTATPTQAAPVANGPYTYAWEVDNGITVTPIANNAATLSAATATAGTYTYTVTVTNTASGCTATDNVVLTINPLPTVDLGVDQIDCNSTGFTGIDLDAGGGFDNYQWSNGTSGATAQTINVTTSNTYTVTITNSGGCTGTDAVAITINQPPAVTATDLSTTPSNCGVDNGSITFPSPTGVTIETGSGFLIGGADITGSSPLTSLGSGNYTLVYTDNATGCFTNVTVNVGSNTTLPPTPIISPASSTICINGSVPSLTASPNGAASTNWQWYGPNNSATVIAGATNAIFNPVALVDNTTAGATTFYVTNTVAGCESLPASVTITVQDPPIVGITTPSGSSVCSGAAITLDADNIVGATYNWSGGGGSTSSATYTPTAPPATVTYTVTVTDGPCTVTPNFVVTVNPNPTAGTLTPTQAICSAANGQIAFTTPAGVTQVLYSTGATFNTGVNTDVTGASPITDLAAGQYTFRFINGATNCFVDASINLTFIATAPPPTVAAVSAICFTGNDASNPTFSATAGGTLVSTYQWYGPAATPAAATAIAGATSSSYAPTVTAPSTYTYYVTNTIGGCESTRTPVSFTINPLPTPSISGNTVVCNGTVTNTLTASAASSYLWGDGSTNQTINGIGGSYAVTVTDANGCQSATAVSVSVNNPVSVTINPDPASFCAGGSIILNAGTGFDTYAWSPAVGLDFSNIAAPTCTGTNLPAPYSLSYNVTVTKNENGISCSATDNISVSVTANPNLTATSSQTITTCIGSTANLNNVTYTNSGAAGTQFFTDPIGDPVLSPSNVPVSAVGTTIYTLTETVSGTGCSDTLQIRVNGVAGITTSNFNANCNIAGTQYVVSFNMSGGTGVYTVTPAGSGTVTGNLFTSNPINTGTGYSFTINSTGATCLPATVGGSAPPCTAPAACNTIGCVGANLVVNGNFESFNAATPFSTFISSYDYSPCPGLICTNGATGAPILCQYDFSVQTSPNSCNTDFSANIHDHTTGSGNLMLVDYPAGNVGSNNHIWCQTVTLAPATNYCFGAYMINILPTGTNQGLPAVNFTANGALLGNSGNIPENEQWGYYGYSFNSGAGGSYQFCIDNSNFGALGYDIAIDDITIAPLTNGTPPTAVNDAIAICSSAASINIPVLTNDSGTFSNSTLSIYSAPPFTDGTITGINTATGTITFTPLPGFTGTSFQYKICDASGSCCSVATVNITLATAPTITTVVVNNTACLTSFTGAATVTAPTGVGVSYLWSDAGASTTAGITAQNAGTYTVTVTGTNGCSSTTTATITSTPTLPSITLSTPTANTSCTAPFTGAVAVTAPTGVGVSYLWSDAGASTTAGITAQNAGTYTVTVTGTNGCSSTTTATITSTPTLPVITLSAPTVNTSCTAPFTGSVAVTAPTGAGVTYLWSDAGASTTAGITAQNAGTYTVTVTGTNGCSSTTTATITSTPTLPAITLSAPTANTSCAAPFTGSVAVTAPTGAGVTYLWSDAGASTTAGITAQNAGTYTVTVTGTNGCSSTTTATITSTPTLPAITLSAPTVNTSCAAPFTGAVAVTAPTGAGVSYLWSDAGASTTAGITAQNAGTYTVTVTGTNGCSSTTTATITSTPTLPAITLSAPTVNTSCAAPFTGAVAVTAPTGAGVSYLWSDAGASTTAGITAQNAGTYTVTVTGTNGCSSTTTATITSTPTLPAITLSAPTVNTSCTSPFTGSVAVTAPTGAGVSYLWSDAGASTTAGITAQNAGTYTVTVTGTNGCSSTTTATITSTPTLPVANISGTNTYCLNSVATNLTASGGNTYLWNTTETTPAITPNTTPAGNTTYTVTVTATNGCTASTTQVITINALPTISVATSCGAAPNTGAITTTATAANGGTLAYTINGTADADGNQINLSNNPYTVVVTETPSGCSTSSVANVNCGCLPITVNGVASICSGAAATTYTQTGGVAGGIWSVLPVTAGSISNAGVFTPASNVLSLINATITYTASGCNGGLVVTINPLPTPTIGGTTAVCIGNSTTLTANSGTSYQWQGGPATAAYPVSPLTNTTYTVTVTDANSCSATATAQVLVNALPTSSNITTPNTACLTPFNGAVDLSVLPAGSYNFVWSNTTTTEDLSLVPSGTYTVTVTNSTTLCSTTTSVTVANNSAAPTTTNTTTANTACLTPFNGAVDLSVLPAGSYNFVWSNTTTTEDLAAVQNGTYTVTVTDPATLCSTTTSVTVANNSAAPTASTTVINNTNCGAIGNGSIDLSVLPAGTYAYFWSGGQTTEDISALSAGSYTVTVTNTTTLCSATATATLSNTPNLPTASTTVINNTNCGSTGNGSIDLSVNPAGTYAYLWSGGQATEDISALSAGNYTVTVTNTATLCSATTTATLSNTPNLPTASTTVINNTNCGSTGNGSIDLSVLPAGTYAYLWSGGQATEDLSALSAGSYTVTVTNTTTLCSATATATISSNTLTPTASISGVNTYCLGDVASSLTASGGGTYAWNIGGTGTTITPSTAAAGSITYTVTVTSANNCTSTATAAVTVNALPAASISGGNICEGSPLNLTASGGSSYNWSGNGVTTAAANPQVINGLTPSTSTYNVTVTAGNGCTSTASTNITVNANPTASISGSSTFCVGGNSVLTASGGGTYQWAASNGGVITGSSSGSSITVNTAGTYAVTVSNNGCIGTASIAVTQATSLSPNITGTTQICPGSTTTLNAGSFSSYLWSASAGNAVTQSVNNIGLGTYSVTVSDASGCTGSASTNVIQLNPTATATNTGAVCQGGTVNLNASVGTAYSWSGPAGYSSNVQNPAINIPNNAPANSYTYTVTVTDNNGCTATASTTVVVNALPTASIGGSSSICSGDAASISLTGTPDAIVTYTVNGGSNQTATLNAAGTATVGTGALTATATYTLVSVVSAAPASCTNTASGSAAITVNPLPTASISGSTSFCSGGSADITFTGTPNATVVYTLNGTTQSLILNASGTITINTGAITNNRTYTLVSVTSAAPASCTNTASGSVVISVNTLPTASAGGGGNVCSASTINLSASGGTTYNWSGAGITASTQNQQNPVIAGATVGMSGTYIVTVTDGNGCTATASTTVTVAPCACPNPPTVSGLSNVAICAGLSANLSVTLGGGATTATWTTSGSGTFNPSTGTSTVYTPSAADVALGSVIITITTDDPDGAAPECSAASTPITLSINALPTAAISGTNTICAGDNTTLTASGGNAYSWTLPNGGGTSSANPLNISNATNTNAGVYAVTVTNANNCTAVANTTVTVNALPTATAGGATVCVGDAINLTSTGGTTYSWSGSGITASTQDQQNPSIAAATAGMAGIYTVTVTGNNTCTATASTTVIVNANPVGAINGTLSFCEGGSTTLTATGGSSYTWAGAGIGNASQASQIISGLSNGTYPYNVTVSNGSCTATATATVTVFASPVAQITGSATFCAGGNTTLDAGAGYASYLWTPGNQNTQTITLSASGSPTVVVTDANGCTASDQITVTSGTALTPNITGDLTICAGQTATLSAGNGFDTYLWSPNGETTFEISVTPAVTTTYSVAVTQANCNGTASQQVVVQVPVAINAGADDFICGYSYALNSNGNNGQWTYVGAQSVVFANALDPQTTVTVNACGVYEFIWTETSGVCQSSDTVQIGFADSPTVVGTCPPETEEVCGNSLGITPASVLGSLCSQSDCPAGSAAYEAILTQLGLDCTGTTSNCHWEWTYLDGPQTDATVTFTPDANTQNVTVSVVPFGRYSFSWVCDVAGTDPSCPTACGAIYAEKIFNFIAPLQANATAICNPSPSTDYVVTVTITGGVPPYTLPNGFSETLASGVPYNYLIDDASTCPPVPLTGSQNCTIVCPTITPTILGNVAFCVGSSIVLSVAEPFVGYQWTSGVGQTLSVSAAGSYTVTVTDSNGCTGTASVLVATTPPTTPTFAAIAAICSGDVAPILPATSIEGIAGTWIPALVSNTASGTYTFTPSAGACASTATINVTVNPQTTPTFAAISAICSGDVAPVLPAVSIEGIAGSWSPALVSNTASGTYTFTPSAGSCASTATVNVTVNASPQISVSDNCTGATADVTVTIVSGTPITYSLDNGTAQASTTFAGVANGNHTIVATDANGCSDSQDFITNCIPGCPTITVTGSQSVCAGTAAVYTQIGGVAGGVWSVVPAAAGVIDAGGNFASSGIFAGNATITYTDNSTGLGCAGSIVVAVDAVTTPTFAAIAAICSSDVAPVLPATSSNGISGSWLPAVVSNTASGTYTFTPSAGSCASTATVNVTVNPQTLPTFAAIAAICSGDVAPILPATSSNGISGTWLPALVSNTASGTYTFTPSAGACASTASINVTVNPQILPTFAAIAAICSGDVAPVLPATSIEGIAGTWLPALVSNTASGTYTFTPSAGSCASTASVDVTVNQSPTVNIIGTLTICEGSTTTLDAGIGFDGYAWSNGGSSQTITVGAGTHTVTVTDNGCTATNQVIVTATALPTNVSATNNCTSNSAATITVTATAAAGATLEYSLDGTNFQAANVFADVPNGGYTVSVRVVGTTCSVTTGISFNCACLNPPTLTIADATVCENATADLATTIVTNTGSTPAYYTNSADANAANATGLLANPSAAPAGTYFIRVEDATDPACFTVEAVTVAELVITPPTVTGLNNPYCVGETVDALTATPNQGGTITWYANTDLTLVVATGNTYIPSTGVQAGAVSYWVAENANGCQGPATQVDVVFEVCVTCNVQTPIGVITELNTCEGTTNTSALEVTNNDPNATIHWYDATNTEVATGTSFVPSVAGTYTAVAVANNDPTCTSPAVTATLTETTVGDAGFVYDEDTYCQGTTNITPNITGTSGGTFSATGGLVIDPVTGTFDATTAGTFTITYNVTGNCPATNTFVVTVIPSITITVSSDVTVLTTGDSAQLTATGATTYTWTSNPTLSCTDCANPVATPTQTTTYIVQTAGDECAEPASITIVVNPGEPALIVPSAFSPNNDGVNDVFRAVYAYEIPENLSMRIYDRWGVCVFESTDLNYGWDGTFKGFDSEVGVYAYTISYNFTGKNTKFLSGNVTLVR